MYAILKKELNYYFTSAVGYVFLAAFCLIGGWFFVTSNLISLNGDIGLIFSNMSSAFLFIIPLLTMNITAQEIKFGTDKLLYTSPLSAFDIVMGKFFAVLVIYMLALSATCVYPILLTKFTVPDFGVFTGNIIGFLLMGMSLISIGIFISTLTTHQIASAIMTFAVLLIMYLLDWLSPAFTGGYSRFVVEFFAVSKRFDLFAEGYVNLSDVVYYLSITAMLVFFTVVKIKKDSSATAKIAVTLVIITFFSINIADDFLCDNYLNSFDLTRFKTTRLSKETEEILGGIDKNINIYSFIPENEDDGILITLDELLKQYKLSSENITYERIDATENPEFVKKYVDLGSAVSLYSVVFECEDKYKVVNVADAVSFNNDSGTLENIMAEQYFTSAIINVTSNDAVKVAMVNGHGERMSHRTLSDILEINNYELSTVNLSVDDLTDIKMLIITTPQIDYSSVEIDKLDEFFKSGGSAQVLIGPDDKDFTNLYSYLQEWGLEFNKGYVVENEKGNYVQSKSFLIPVIKSTPITESFADNFNILVPYARAINMRNVEGVDTQVILETTENARIKNNIRSTTATFEDGDIDGKFVLSAYLTRSYGNVASSIMAVGSTAFIDSDYVNQSSFVNSEFLLKGAAQLTNNEKTVNISPKKIGNSLLNITASDLIRLGILTIIIMPLLFVAAGIVVWIKRRKM